MIRTAKSNDEERLSALYEGSVYGCLPSLVKWALSVVPERVVVVEKHREIEAVVYTMTCGYDNLWSSYLAFQHEKEAEQLVDHLLDFRREKKLRNLYLFCPKEFEDIRVYLIQRGFIPEDVRRIGAMDHIVESHNGIFPNYQDRPSTGNLPVRVREGRIDDAEAVSKILHSSLPRDFSTSKGASRCAQRWLTEMPEDALGCRDGSFANRCYSP